jgi:hypothetical protein
MGHENRWSAKEKQELEIWDETKRDIEKTGSLSH